MRHSSAAAALAVAAVIGALGAPPGVAAAQTAPATARAAWIKSCEGEYDSRPCGHWQLIMRDGRKIAVPDAATTRIDGSGAKADTEGVFAISADGRWIGYERARDHRLVVRRASGGPVTELPRSLAPKRFGTENLGLYLSARGDKAMVDYTEEGEREPGVVVTVATGATVKLPAGDSLQEFSADGDEVLALRYRPDNTTMLVAHRLGGGAEKRTPPQVVVNSAGYALAEDGKTVAVIVAGNEETGKAPRLRLYDVVSGELTAGVELPFKPAATVTTARWSGDRRLTMTVSTGKEGGPAVVRVLTVDADTGAATQQDRYSISKRRYAAYAAGE